MPDYTFPADHDTVMAILTEIRRIAPELPEDSGFAFGEGVMLTEMLRRLQELPDGAGVGAIAAVMDGPPPA